MPQTENRRDQGASVFEVPAMAGKWLNEIILACDPHPQAAEEGKKTNKPKVTANQTWGKNPS